MIEDPEPKLGSGSKQGRGSPANSHQSKALADSGRMLGKKSGMSMGIGGLVDSLRQVGMNSLRQVNEKSIDG